MKITKFVTIEDKIEVLKALANIVEVKYEERVSAVQVDLKKHKYVGVSIVSTNKELVLNVGELSMTDSNYAIVYDLVNVKKNEQIMRVRELVGEELSLDKLLIMMQRIVHEFMQ